MLACSNMMCIHLIFSTNMHFRWHYVPVDLNFYTDLIWTWCSHIGYLIDLILSVPSYRGWLIFVTLWGYKKRIVRRSEVVAQFHQSHLSSQVVWSVGFRKSTTSWMHKVLQQWIFTTFIWYTIGFRCWNSGLYCWRRYTMELGHRLSVHKRRLHGRKSFVSKPVWLSRPPQICREHLNFSQY